MPFLLFEQLDRIADADADGCAYAEVAALGEGRTLSWSRLRVAVRGAAAWTSGRFPEGGTIMLCCPNVCEFPAAFLGILSAGCSVFPVSTEMTPSELQSAAEKSSARGLVGTPDSIAALAGRVEVSLRVEDVLYFADGAPSAGNFRSPGGSLLLQSSGTTGLPKIVRRSLAALDAVSSNTVNAIGFGPSDRVLATVPLCHSYGLEHGLLAPIRAGSTVRLCRGLDLGIAVDQLRGGGITLLPGVPSMFEMLAGVGDGPHDMPELRCAYSAGARLPESVANRFHARHGVRVGQVYGATEVGSVTFNDPADESTDVEAVGRPMEGVRIEIRHPLEASRVCAAGEEGQVCIAAPSAFDGYVGEPDLPHGWPYLTGDLGFLDPAGCLRITGRLKLLIDVGGLKVNPMEVEDVFLRHPHVGACVVLPIRLSETVSRLKAVVSPKDGCRLPEPAELRRFVRTFLSPYKVPRVIEIRAALPRSATGKVLRHLVEAT